MRVPHQSHVPGIDGLRCLAVGAVILFHADFFEAGWAGVWLFFVISGFVITRSLLADIASGLPASEVFRQFYLKRSFRILPLYLAAIVVFSLMISSFSSDRNEKLQHLPYLLTFSYNFYRLGSTYVHNHYFGHFWSLSVEEQFYLVYPMLLILLGVTRLSRALLIGLIAFPLIRLIVSLAYGAVIPAAPVSDLAVWRGNAVYQFSIAQFDAFACGALIALNERRIRAARFALPAIASLALAALTIYAAIYGALFGGLAEAFRVNLYGDYGEIWLYSVVDLVSATLLVAVLTGWQPLLWLCTLKAPRYLGRISFGIYVIHFPMMEVIGERSRPFLQQFLQQQGLSFLDNSFIYLLLFGGLTVFFAHLSYSRYERPMMRLGRRLLGRGTPVGASTA
jgi:peptidoglycan/LPS O-acetylase OafA/YrhL